MSVKENAIRKVEHSEFLIKRALLQIKSGCNVPESIFQDLCQASTNLIIAAGDVRKTQNFRTREVTNEKREDYLQAIKEDDELSKEQIKAIKHGPTHRDEWKLRQKFLERIKSEVDRNARIELSYDQELKKYKRVVYRDGADTEEEVFPAWNKLGVKRVFEYDQKIEVPWKRIQSGETWSIDTILSVYYLEDIWNPIPRIIPLRKNNSY